MSTITLSKTETSRKLDKLLEGYQFCARSEGKSENTITLTTIAVNQLIDYLAAEKLSTDVADIDALVMRKFITHLQQRRVFYHHPFAGKQNQCLTKGAVNDYMRSLSAFWAWLFREEIIDINVFTKVKIPKAPHRIIVPYFTEQIDALLAVVDGRTSVGCRDLAIVLLLLDDGPRASELCQFELENLDLNQRLLKAKGKGDKERILPLGTKTQRAIWKYIEHSRPEPANPRANYLFLTRDGQQLTRRHIGTILKRYGEKVGVKYSPHRFRHTFAINFLRNGGDVFSLQRILGHTTLDTVRIYVNLANIDIQDAHRRCSPVDNLSFKSFRNKPAAKNKKNTIVLISKIN
ncbi:MAG: tyrosine-type recombinase/integrase [Dehalococcoidales bacterium]|nr:tyrosine-type recombinase/integrase [Dehalococcoidales bacterium]